MLRKTMKQIINKKIKEWIGTIEDQSVINAIKKDLIITGGCFTSMILNETPKDFDCYFRTKETVLIIANYYANIWGEKKEKEILVLDGGFYKDVLFKNSEPDRIMLFIKSKGIGGNPELAGNNEETGININETIKELDEIEAEKIIEQEKKNYFPVFISSNAITLSNGIQLIVRFYGEPEKIHDTYDYLHTKGFYDIKEDKINISADIYEYTINKTLKYTGSKYPICSMFRMRKFINKGWTINAGQILKICMQISELDLKNIEVLEDQLIGVDSLYFMQLIEQFKNRKEKDPNFELTSNYIISIIDKIF